MSISSTLNKIVSAAVAVALLTTVTGCSAEAPVSEPTPIVVVEGAVGVGSPPEPIVTVTGEVGVGTDAIE